MSSSDISFFSNSLQRMPNPPTPASTTDYRKNTPSHVLEVSKRTTNAATQALPRNPATEKPIALQSRLEKCWQELPSIAAKVQIPDLLDEIISSRAVQKPSCWAIPQHLVAASPTEDSSKCTAIEPEPPSKDFSQSQATPGQAPFFIRERSLNTLRECVQNGDLFALDQFFASQPDNSYYTFYALSFAVRCGQLLIFRKLRDQRLLAEGERKALARIAIDRNDLPILQEILKKGTVKGSEQVDLCIWAIHKGNLPILREILKTSSGLKSEFWDALFRAAIENLDLPILRELQQKNQMSLELRENGIRVAIIKRHQPILHELLKSGPVTSTFLNAALQHCQMLQDWEIFEQLSRSNSYRTR